MSEPRWNRKSPGLYRLCNSEGECLAAVERGSVSGWWFWSTHGKTGMRKKLRDAKDAAEKDACEMETVIARAWPKVWIAEESTP